MRGSRSQDLRAASFRELYYSQSIPPGGFFGYVQNPTVPPGHVRVLRRSSLVDPRGKSEVEARGSDDEDGTVSSLSPSGGADGLHFSADYYDIAINGGQRLDGSTAVINGCYNLHQAEQCARITYGPPVIPGNPTSNIFEVHVPYINASPYLPKASISRSTIRCMSGAAQCGST